MNVDIQNHEIGHIIEMSHAASVPNTLTCDGSAVSRTVYAKLFAAIGTTYGSGDGSTTFNLPDSRSRSLMGAGTGGGLSARVIGATLGEETHLLSTSEMAAHSHSGTSDVPSVTAHSHDYAGSNVNPPYSNRFDISSVVFSARTNNTFTSGTGGSHTHTIASVSGAGGATAFNKVSPCLVAKQLIVYS